MAKINKYKFESGAMSIIQMGEELIGHPSTAINELVKNSYDADADNCWVYTQYDKNPNKNFLIIKDAGLGMNESILFGDWLKPSKSSKRDENIEKRVSEIYNRKYLGSKGIGRLAAMALGRYLTVISKQSNEIDYNWIRIDREDFRVEASLESIKFPGGKISNYLDLFNDEDILEQNKLSPNGNLINLLKNKPFLDFKEGTTIIIQDLDSSLKNLIEDEFEIKSEIQETSIFKSLRDLITPLLLNSKIQKDLLNEKIIDTEISIDNGEGTFELFYGINFIKNQIKGVVDFLPIEPSDILDHYNYRVFGKSSDKGDVIAKYICNRFEVDKYDLIFDIPSEFNLSNETPKVRTIDEFENKTIDEKLGVGEFYFDFRVYDLDPDAKDKMVKILNAKGKKEANDIFSKYLGLRISKNGFGVKPYGDEERDWMGLGAKRVQKHIFTIGPNQIIGNIFLFSPENDGLKEKTNREGFYESKEFVNFKKIIAGVLKKTGQERAKYRLKHNLGRKTINRLNRPDTEKFIQYILNNSSNELLVEKTREFVLETNDALDNMESTLSFSQRLASLGTGLELVYHELAQPIGVLGGVKTSLEININKINDDLLKSKLLDRTSNMSSAIGLLEELKKSMQPAIGRSFPKIFKPSETFKKVCYLFEKIFEELDITLEIKKGSLEFQIKDYEYVFWVSFLNIVNNAVYWLKYVDKRIIIFEIDENKIIISNTGPKIQEEDIEVIFEYGITGKKEKNATGLGLSFTKNMLASKNWQISAKNRSYGPAFIIKK